MSITPDPSVSCTRWIYGTVPCTCQVHETDGTSSMVGVQGRHRCRPDVEDVDVASGEHGPMSGKRFQILSLDGGGLRGMFSAAVLARLEEDLDVRIADHFDLIAG